MKASEASGSEIRTSSHPHNGEGGGGGEMKDDSKKSTLCFHFTVTILVTKPNCRRTCVRERKKTPKCKQVSHALEEAMQAV